MIKWSASCDDLICFQESHVCSLRAVCRCYFCCYLCFVVISGYDDGNFRALEDFIVFVLLPLLLVPLLLLLLLSCCCCWLTGQKHQLLFLLRKREKDERND